MNGLTIRPGSELAAATDAEWTVEQMVAQSLKIQTCMRAVMKDGEHYGVIPGTNTKPTLLKPGAEKLCLMFRLDPEYDIMTNVETPERIAFTIRCTLTHIPTGQRIASGLGSCNSREAKYMRPAPKKCPQCSKESIIKGKEEYGGGWLCYAKKGGCGAKFKDGDTAIEKQDNGLADPADLHNTILKMGCKRALVAAVLNGTAASDFFTQDLEDLAEKAAEYIPPPVRETSERIAGTQGAPGRSAIPKDGGASFVAPSVESSRASDSAPHSSVVSASNSRSADLDADWRAGTPSTLSIHSSSTNVDADAMAAAPKPRTAADVKPTGGLATPQQIKLIHVLKAQVGGVFSGDGTDPRDKWAKTLGVYRNADGGRCAHSNELSSDQASHLIDRIQGYVEKQGQRAAAGVDIGAVDRATKQNKPPSLEDLLPSAQEPDDITPGSSWLMGLFGVDSLNAMDRTEKQTALELLLALNMGPDAYDAAQTNARQKGRIR